MIEWSDKQQSMLDAILSDTETVILVGPLGSGKSLPAVHGLLLWCIVNLPTKSEGIIASYTSRQLDASILRPAEDWCRANGCEWVRRTGPKYELIKGRKTITFWPLMGANKGDDEKAKSYNASFLLADEAADLTKDFVLAASARVRVEGPKKILLVTNPSGPQHWLKRDWIDTITDDSDTIHISSQLTDNPSLSEAYIQRLSNSYTGSAYKRLVLGEWAASSGLIWADMATIPEHEVNEHTAASFTVGVDDADSGVLHAVLVMTTVDNTRIVVDELRYDGRERGPLSAEKRAQRIALWAKGRQVRSVVVDPSAVALIAELGRQMRCKIIGAERDVLEGCQYVAREFSAGRLHISTRCSHLIREAGSYQWDENYAERGEDKPVKLDDHGCDALRYVLWSAAKVRPAAKILVHK